MAKDPSFDWWLDRQIDEHMTPELEEEEDEDCTLCEKEVGETCECFICAGCSELALGSECHSNKKDEGMYCKDC